MRRVLVVSYDFPPAYSVAAKQFVNYCRCLPEHGWEPVVLSNDWSGGLAAEDVAYGLSYEPGVLATLPPSVQVHRVPVRRPRNRFTSLHGRLSRLTRASASPAGRGMFTPLRKGLSTFWPSFGLYPDAFAGWIGPAVARGEQIARSQRIDAILSNCPPETNHVVASKIARRTGKPWLPFFGDLYGFYIGPGDWHHAGWRGAYTRQLHRLWMRPAAESLAVSPAMAEAIRQTYGVQSNVVVTGYDPREFASDRRPGGNRLRLAHVGSIYPGDQRPEILLDGVDVLLARRPGLRDSLEILFVGERGKEAVNALLLDRAAASVCRVVNRVPPDEAIRIQQSCHGLLLFNCTTPRAVFGTLSYPSKLFEYLGARRPILAIPHDRDWVDRIMATTSAGLIADTATEVADILETWHEHWERTGSLPYHGDAAAMADFELRKQGELIAQALDAIARPIGRGQLKRGESDLGARP